MEPADVRAFVDRNWTEAGRAKRAYWAMRHRAEGANATREASDALWTSIRRIRPDYPTAADRAADHRAHERLAELLTRAAHAFTRRAAAR